MVAAGGDAVLPDDEPMSTAATAAGSPTHEAHTRHPRPAEYAAGLARAARKAGRRLADVSSAVKDAALRDIAAALEAGADRIIAANQLDLAAGRDNGLAEAMLDRLALHHKRIAAMAEGVREIAALPDPVGEILGGGRRPNGLEIRKVRVPLGAVLTIYESRPNVTVDVAALCLKSGNAAVLRGGREALHTNTALHAVIAETLPRHGLPAEAVQLVAVADREVVGHLLKCDRDIDLVIPRGGEGLIRRVVEESRIPVIKHYRGNCHVYVDAHADLDKARRITVNAKTHRVSVCNAAETLLVHSAVAAGFLPAVAADLAAKGCEIRGCPRTKALVPDAKAAAEEDWFEEYLALILAVKVVDSLDEAVEHINTYGSRHTEAIVTRDLAASRRFAAGVDSASVMINASTRFADGNEYGLGAEVGISTDKLHARGPMGAADLTTHKWIVVGDGHVRE
jgi:glutamate-5-semialdehyde dehydrogenase